MAEKWDGVTRAADIARVLTKFISEEDRRTARVMAYGDFGRLIQKRHGGCHRGASVGDDMVEADMKGITVTFDFADGGDAYTLTWNKAAKLIHEYIIYYDNYGDDGEDDDDEDEKVTDVSPIESPKEYMSENAKYAFTVHAQIVTGAQMVEDGLYLMAVGFKKMRDEKLYKELGYKSFEEYCETETQMNRRNVYKYISIVEKLPAKFVSSKTQIGKEKLFLLTTLTDEQREEIVQSADLESTTVKELKAKIDELTGAVQREKDLKEQWQQQVQKEVELSTANAERLNKELADRDDERKRLKNMGVTDTEEYKNVQRRLTEQMNRNAELEREIKELEERPIEVAVESAPTDDEEILNFYHTLQETLEKALNNIYMFVRDHKGQIDEWRITNLNSMAERYRRRFLEYDD